MISLTQNVRPTVHSDNDRPCANSPSRVLGKPQVAVAFSQEGGAVLTSETPVEEWRPVVGFEGLYEVSSLGRVRSLDHISRGPRGTRRLYRGRVLSPDGSADYCRVTLHKGAPTRLTVHKLVGMAFLPPNAARSHINHKDGNKRNNAASNLEWCTPAENTRHAWETGLSNAVRGERSGQAKVRECDIDTIRAARNRGVSLAQIALVFNISETAVSYIARGISWAHHKESVA